VTTRQMIAGTFAVVALLVAGAVPASASQTPSSGSGSSPKTYDYCGGQGRSAIVPEHWRKANFTSECNNHDKCYSRGSDRSRKDCDKGLRIEMWSECHSTYARKGTKDYSRFKFNMCLDRTNDYYWGVRRFAKKHYHGSGSRK
jgi:hypothetical protein